MNPSNPFGSPQGAFQAPSSSVKSSLFQPSFGQQGSPSQSFLQPSAFGQSSVLNPSTAKPMFGQAPSFGQTAQPPSLSTTSQAPAFGMTTSGFAAGKTPAFGQTTGLNQGSIFSQTPAFGQTATAFGQPSTAFGQPSTAFGQPSTAFGQPSTAFGQPSTTFGQPSTAFGQAPPAFGQTSSASGQAPPAFGQTSSASGQAPPAFGQTSSASGQAPPAFGQTSSASGQAPPAFGQTSSASGQAPPAFGQTSSASRQAPPAFGQTSSASGQAPPAFGQTTSAFGQKPPAFGQTPSAFGQAPGFGKAAFGQQQSSVFGSSQMMTDSTSLGQPPSFGQSVFGKPSSTSSSTSVFGGTQTTTQNQGFRSTDFSFKPANEAVFKPIFSASPEPANPQTTTAFGSQTESSSKFSLLTTAKPGAPGFSFSQPAIPSISVQNNTTTGTSTGSTGSLQFTFSQPAAPSSSATTEPITPSSFSFTAKTLQTQPAILSGGAPFVPSAFGDAPAKTDTNTDGKGVKGDTNIFAQLNKTFKSKEEPAVEPTGSEKPPTEEDVPTDANSPRQPSKRPLIRSRGPPGGLFGRALSGIRRDCTNPVKQDILKEPQKMTQDWEENQPEDPSQDDDLTEIPPKMTKNVPDKQEVPDPAVSSGQPVEELTPKPHRGRSESQDSLSELSLCDQTILHCKNIPLTLNKKQVLEKHFSQAGGGKVIKIICQPAKNVAIVHFENHATAARAKKKGKLLQGNELLLLWRRKKQSPAGKVSRLTPAKDLAEEVTQEVPESKAATSSPLRRPALRAAALGSLQSFSKMSPVKVLQFETEPVKETNTETQSLERPILSSLLHLIGQVAETTEEKYRLLEQRDKILRQGRPKRTDIHLSSVFVGTCPDMCPEKERYMRETRNQLSVFEVIPETEMVDHAAAIKEYSRSSADQEEPLPHELRPLPVLSMTMDYLVTQIIDQVQDNYRDWYDFVWNRTRGIRKDITQQRLCCPHTVSLIEKCTRFHVHCAHHLCEEPMMSFDAKINNENMTKCLQSLKEMYEDLAMQQILCPNEAEFRQYSVLLKLNDGDILRDVQQFRLEIRKSPEVKFAVQAFAAVNSNNFVRFFKLVKKASYLACCLLHRYFNQVRAKALKALNLAHTIGPRATPFPVEDVVRMLMFRDTAEATDFLQQYGLYVNDGMVELSRMAFQEPELPFSQKKSEVILSKKVFLVGQVVNGGPLPNPPQHQPERSFDSQNKYRPEGPAKEPVPSFAKAVTAKVELTAAPSTELAPPDVPPAFLAPPAVPDQIKIPSHPPTQPADPQPVFELISTPQPVAPPPEPEPVFTDEDILPVMNSLLEEVVAVEVTDVAHDGACFATTALSESSKYSESLVDDVLKELLQEISSSEVKLEQERVAEEKRKLEEERRREEHRLFLAEFSFSLFTEILHEVVDEAIQETATSEIQEAVDEEERLVDCCADEVCSCLIDDTLDTEISLLVDELLTAELRRIHKYIKRWRDVVAVRRQLKRQMRSFPAAPCCVDPHFKLGALAPTAPHQPCMADLAQGLVNLGNAGVLTLSSTRSLQMRREVIHQMRVQFFYQQLLEETVWTPLNLPALVAENLLDPPERIFWKALLLLPSDQEGLASVADGILSDWLEVKFGGNKKSDEQPDGLLETLCISNSVQQSEHQTHEVYVTVKASHGPLTEDGLSKVEESSELQGTTALIMLLPVVEPCQEEQDVPLLSALLQLKQLQKANSWHCPLPLLILVPGQELEAQKLEEALMLLELKNEGLISEYTFFFIPETTSDLQGSNQLNQAVSWLLARAPPPLPLTGLTLMELVESTLGREFISRVSSHRQERATAGLAPQEPAPVILLYNAVLDYVADLVASPDLCGLSWPPGEFCSPEASSFIPHRHWNSVQHLSWLRSAILSLQLPPWNPTGPTDSWGELCSSIFRYAAALPSTPQSQPLLMSRLENLFERIRQKERNTKSSVSRLTSHQLDLEGFSLIPWDDVVIICVDHKLKDWKIPGPPICEDAVAADGEILVYFSTDSSCSFQPPEEWTQAVRQTHREKWQTEGPSVPASVPSTSFSFRQTLFPRVTQPVEATPALLDITHTATAQELLAHTVLQSLQEEQAETKRSMEQLQRWLDGDPVEHLSTPLFLPSSTILCTPSIRLTQREISREAASTRQRRVSQQEETVTRNAPVSLMWRLEDLNRQILMSQEEEVSCRLRLSGMLTIVED